MSEQAKTDILVIDDDESVRTLLMSALRIKGYSLRCASEGNEALRLLSTHSFRLIITDIYMPGTDGLEVIMQHVTKDPKTPILAISGGGRCIGPDEILSSAKLLGSRKTMAKPFEVADLYLAVSDLLGNYAAPASTSNTALDP